MIHRLVILGLVLGLSACDTMPPRVETVVVPKVVLYTPKPPNVPVYEFEVDKLSANDKNQPGKVGKAYVHDMTILRHTDKIMRAILKQYENSALDVEKIQPLIDALYKDIGTLQGE